MRRVAGASVLAVACLALSLPARALDMDKVTCRAFLASGTANMGAMIMWLRGYHAGKGGTVAFAIHNPYGGRLGYYCRNHPDERVIDASERILAGLDGGI